MKSYSKLVDNRFKARHPKLQHKFMGDLPPLTQKQTNTIRGGGGLDPNVFQRKPKSDLRLPYENLYEGENMSEEDI